MALPPTPVPQFPDVPNAPGVPTVLRAPGAVAVAGVIQMVADAAGVSSTFGAPQWGIFDTSGNPVIVADSVLDVAFRQEYRISTAPQEQGAFVSYDKVQLPFDGRVTFAQSGEPGDRQAFLQQILTAAASLDLVSLVMPEITYLSVNIIHHDFRRTARAGVQLLAVDVWVQQVRVTGTAAYTNTQQPSGANPVNGGSVQPLDPAQNSNLSTAGTAVQNAPSAGGLT